MRIAWLTVASKTSSDSFWPVLFNKDQILGSSALYAWTDKGRVILPDWIVSPFSSKTTYSPTCLTCEWSAALPIIVDWWFFKRLKRGWMFSCWLETCKTNDARSQNMTFISWKLCSVYTDLLTLCCGRQHKKNPYLDVLLHRGTWTKWEIDDHMIKDHL